jgi:hypothetical protein
MVLRNNAVMPNLVHRDYSSEFVAGVGDTITIRKPAKFEAKEFSGSISVQDATESGVPVVMDKHLDVSFSVTSKQLSMDIKDFSEQLLVPAMQAFNDKIDKYLIGLQAQVANRVSHSSGLIAPADIIAAREMLTESATPLTNRRLVIGAKAEANLLNSEQFISAEKVGDNGTALREASLGRKYGFDIYTDQNIKNTNGGSITFTGTLAVDGAVSGSKSVTIDATTLTGTMKAGDVLLIGGEAYIVSANATASSNEISVTVDRNLTCDDNTAVTYFGAYVPSIAFHKNAMALVTRPLALPKGAKDAAIVNYDGFGLRVVYGYDMNSKTDTISIDMLCGVKLLDQDLIAVISDMR